MGVGDETGFCSPAGTRLPSQGRRTHPGLLSKGTLAKRAGQTNSLQARERPRETKRRQRGGIEGSIRLISLPFKESVL